jgi:hypothetical protein
MAAATGNHLPSLSGRLIRMPIRKMTNSPSMSALYRPCCTIMEALPSSPSVSVGDGRAGCRSLASAS